MARLPRLFLPDQPQIILQRGVAAQAICPDADGFSVLQAMLADAVRAQGLALHAYALMPGHFQLIVSAPESQAIARALQSVGRRYVQYFNRRMDRHGTLWEGRYRSAVLDAEALLITCMRYVEFDPVRAGLAADPDHHAWSSYRHHAGVEPCSFITDHALYWALGNTPFERQAVYKARCEQPLAEDELQRIRTATLGGWGLGDAGFLTRISASAQRRAQPLARGRPPKAKTGNS